MNRRQLAMHIVLATAFVALATFALSADAQILGGKGGKLFGGHGGSAKSDKCEDCTCFPYTLNICRGLHDCCGCGCAQSGYCNWCGHGKDWGWTLRSGRLLPKCSRKHLWKQYYYGHGGYGGGGCGCGPGCGGSGGDLFYNYYAPQTGPGGGVTTQMYTSPHGTPSPVPQTYYTYQPWMPHEHMYHHNRSYLNYHSGPYGRTQTDVSWGASPIIRHFD